MVGRGFDGCTKSLTRYPAKKRLNGRIASEIAPDRLILRLDVQYGGMVEEVEQPARSRLPKSIWAAAAELEKRHGLHS